MGFTITLNGQPHRFELSAPASLSEVAAELGLKQDRIAIERNGELAPRSRWAETVVLDGDKLEIVHFVGGGSWEAAPMSSASRRSQRTP